MYVYLDSDTPLPFPSLDNIKTQLIPIYSLVDTMNIETADYWTDFGFA